MEIKSALDELNELYENNILEDITEIEIDKLVSFENHPFELYEGERLEALIESIKENGVLNPIIIRPKKENQYEIIAGHNRVEASKKLGLMKIPAIIRELNDEDAEIVMIETNLQQRSFNDMYPSEQAKVLEIKYKEMKKQGIRTDLSINQEPVSTKKYNSRGRLAEEFNLSSSKIFRLIKLNNLIDEYKLQIDNKDITMKQALKLAELSSERQFKIYKITQDNNIKLNNNILEAITDETDINDFEEIIKLSIDEKEECIRLKIPLSKLGNLKILSKKNLKEKLENIIYEYIEKI